MVKTAGAAIVLLVLVNTSSACGPSARQKAIATTFAATEAASAQFVAFDRKHQMDIVGTAGNRADGEAALAAYRAKRDEARKAFEGAWRAIAAAATLNDDASFTGMVQAATLLSQELHDLGVSP